MRALRIVTGIRPAPAAAVLAFAADALYLTMIGQQAGGVSSRVEFVAASLAGAGAACATADVVSGAAGGLAAAWAAATLWVWAVLGLASIGVAIVPAAVLATTALMRRAEPDLVVAAGIAVALLAAGACLTWTS